MKKCVFEREDILEELEMAADRAGVQGVATEVEELRAKLLPTLSESQKALFHAYDDAILSEGAIRVQGALIMACHCPACNQVGLAHDTHYEIPCHKAAVNY